MKGVSILYDEVQQKRIIQIVVEDVDEHEQAIEDLLDVILAEAAADDEKYDWEEAKKILREEGRL